MKRHPARFVDTVVLDFRRFLIQAQVDLLACVAAVLVTLSLLRAPSLWGSLLTVRNGFSDHGRDQQLKQKASGRAFVDPFSEFFEGHTQ